MFRLLEESFRYEPFVTFGLAVFACYFALIALNIVYYYYLFHFLWFCSYAFLALVAFISFSSCCNPLRTFIVEQCLSLGPFFVSPLPPSLDYAFVASRYEEVSRLRRVLCEPPVVGKTREEPKSPIPYFKYNHDDWIRFHTPNGGAKNFYPVDVEVYETLEDLLRGIFPHRRNDDRKKSHSNRSPTVLPDAVDLLCEQFAAMDLGPSAQASASVQHQDEPSSSMPVVDVNRDAVVQSWENEADADSLALDGTLSSSPTGTPFPDCDVEMDDSFVDDSNEIPFAAAGEIGPVAMDIGGDSLSMDSRVQELEHQHVQQESTVGFNITDAMHTAAALAFMPPAQEQSMPEENTPANGTDNYSDDFSLEIIADAVVAEASEHEQDVGDSTASDALATNMLPSLDQSNNTTVGNASSVGVSSDLPTMTNASTLVEDANDEGKALSFKLDFSKAATFQPVKQRCATFVASLPIIEEEDDTSEDEEVHVGADELAEGDASELIPAYQDPAVEPDSSVAAPSVRGVKRGLDTTDDSTFSTDEVEYAPVVRRRVDEGDSESLDSQDGQSEENGEAIVPIQDQNTTVPGPSVAAPSVRGVKRGLDTTEDTFSTDEAEYVSVRRRRIDEGDTNISINHGRSEEDRVGVDGLMNDDEAPLLPPPQAARPQVVENILAEILGDDDDED
ncbi:hypothetical protein BDC45DRAFT_565338 [Circinella umbellata]|nr:hypothetical protein BDC45DRAFT_565338 [Circinella umbellata]